MESYWAKIENDLVVSVEVVGDSFVQANPERYSGTWKKVGTDTQKLAGKDYIFITEFDKIIEQKPYDSWVLNKEKTEWKSTKEKPEGNYTWDEDSKEWVVSTKTKP